MEVISPCVLMSARYSDRPQHLPLLLVRSLHAQAVEQTHSQYALELDSYLLLLLLISVVSSCFYLFKGFIPFQLVTFIFMTSAGVPAITQFGLSTLLVTVAFAPIEQLSAIVMSPKSIAPGPI